MALPKDYKVPEKKGSYMKFQKGENKFRIMSDIITGNSYWVKDEEGNPKPVRKRIGENIQVGDIEGQLRHFWAMVVWSYELKKIVILEITQNTIQKAIAGYERNKDYGDSKGYDITVERDGDGLETSYTVMPSPPRVVAPDITNAFKEATIDLEQLYSTEENPYGGDPFSVKGPEDIPDTIEPDDLPFD